MQPCRWATRLTDYARCHAQEDDLVGVLAIEYCEFFLRNWSDDLILNPFPRAAERATPTPEPNPYDVSCRELRLEDVMAGVVRGDVRAQGWIDRCEPWINEIPDDRSICDDLTLVWHWTERGGPAGVQRDEFIAYRAALSRLRSARAE